MLVLIVIIVIIVVVDSNRREKIEDREDRREIKVESQKVEKPSKFSLCGRKRRRRATIFGALIGAKVAKGYGTTDGHTCVKLPIPSLDSCCCTGTYDIVYWSMLLCRLTVYCTNYTVL